MKKVLLFLLLLGYWYPVFAQSYVGFIHDNYAGVNSVLYNPASIADSRFKADVNLFSVSSALGNDLYAVKLSEVMKSGFDFDNQATMTATSTNNLRLNVDLMGPAFMFNIAPKHTIAVFTRVRSYTNGSNINGELINQVKDGIDLISDFNLTTGNVNLSTHSWGELGVSYATVLLNNKQHFVKGGFSAKFLQGGFNGYAQINNANLTFDRNQADPRLSTLTTSGQLIIGASQRFGNDSGNDFDTSSRGFGIDLGFVYEWRPDHENYVKDNENGTTNRFKNKNKYKVRLSMSVTDIGSINYKSSVLDRYNVNGSITQEMIEKVDELDQLYDLLEDNYTKIATTSGKQANLPTAIRAAVDWNVYRKFYINLDTDINTVSSSALNVIRTGSRVSLTPRFESKFFSFYVPISQMEYTGTQMGAGFRLGILYAGSSSIISHLLADPARGLDFHLGLKIPIYQRKFKDRVEEVNVEKKEM